MAVISDKALGYLVVCHLTPDRDYAGFLKGLARFHHKELFEGVWMVRTKASATEIYRQIYRRVGPEDQILVFEITNQGCWSESFPDQTSIWIKNVVQTIAPCSYERLLSERRSRDVV